MCIIFTLLMVLERVRLGSFLLLGSDPPCCSGRLLDPLLINSMFTPLLILSLCWFYGWFTFGFFRGRKRACVTYCLTYIMSCITKHSPQYKILMIGRILGGIATSLLFSAFESWLVAEHNKVRIDFRWVEFHFAVVDMTSGGSRIYIKCSQKVKTKANLKVNVI